MGTDEPSAIDDVSWIAIRKGEVDAIVKVLDLSEPKPATWTRGMEVVGGHHDECPKKWGELAGVYITPLIRGWRLVVGLYTGAGPETRSPSDLRTGWRKVASWCRRLSGLFGKAHAFTDQAQLDWYSWILCQDGVVQRQVVFEDGLFLSNRGAPSAMESRMISRFRPDEIRPRWQPDVGDVPRIAGEQSVNPWRIDERTRLKGDGYVAVTPWGRKDRVVFSELGC
jgi:hypothetical protein